MLGRRSFIAGVGAVLATPAIARADNLMRMRGVVMPRLYRRWVGFYSIYDDMTMARFDASTRPMSMPEYGMSLHADQIACLERFFSGRIALTEKAAASDITPCGFDAVIVAVRK